jgi:hypothetical protein
MILYMAMSGNRTKVGITQDLETRTYSYNSHNPSARLVPKVSGLSDWEARLLERITHEILCSTENEWTLATEPEVDEAIAVASECMQKIELAMTLQIVNTIPRLGDPEQIARQTPPGQRAEMKRLARNAISVFTGLARACGGES